MSEPRVAASAPSSAQPPSRSCRAPVFSRGALAWIRANLFSSWMSGALTLAAVALLSG